MIYVFDNNISPRYAAMLRGLGVDVQPLRELFPANIKDTEYLPQLRDCVLITADQRIRTRKAEAAALRQSGVTTLFLARFWAKLSFWDGASWLVARWPDIEQFASTVPAGTCAEVKQRGRIRLIDV